MGRKRPPGLIKRGETWYIKKSINGRGIRESCRTGNLEEAEKHLARRMEEIRQATVFGVSPSHTFRDAGIKFLKEHQHLSCIKNHATTIKVLDPHIGELDLETVHTGTLQSFIEERQEGGVKAKTINGELAVVRRILNLAASEWIDEYGKTWLLHAPKIKLLSATDERMPYPISWDEQKLLFQELPDHMKNMCLFKVNTGCRDQEVCGLRWEWEKQVMGTTVFVIPAHAVKNRHERLVVLNHVAKSIVETVRGQHSEYVFSRNGHRIARLNTTAWQNARERVGLKHVRVHDLKHTFGRRLRAAGVSFEDRQDLLGHISARITTHYSAAELSNLIAAANKVCDVEIEVPNLVV